MLNDYTASAYYQARLSYWNNTASHGTQAARKFWFRWGSPEARYIRRSIKEFRYETKRNARSNIRNRLKSVNIDTTEEEIETVLTDCFSYENKKGKWYWFD